MISLPVIFAGLFQTLDLFFTKFPPDLQSAVAFLRPSVWIWPSAIAASLAIAHGWAWYDERKLRQQVEDKIQETKDNLADHHRIEIESKGRDWEQSLKNKEVEFQSKERDWAVELRSKERDWESERTSFLVQVNSLEKHSAALSEDLRLERERNKVSHPDLILERVGNMTTGTLRVYNRGTADAFNPSISDLITANGMITWRVLDPHIAPQQWSKVTFILSSPGQDKKRLSAQEEREVVKVALMFHVNLEAEPTEEEIAKAFLPVERMVPITYFNARLDMSWKTPCIFKYTRSSGLLEIIPEKASPVTRRPV